MSRIWVDVGDLFDYANIFRRPSGIQRVVFELGQAMVQGDDFAHGFTVGFVRHGAGDSFVPVPWSSVAELFSGLTEEDAPALPSRPVQPRPWLHATSLQLQALRALAAIPQGFWPQRRAKPETLEEPNFLVMQANDVLLVAGAGWSDPTYVTRIAAAKARDGFRVALLVYDIIPLRRPEWFEPSSVHRFRLWLDGLLAVSDHLLAISVSTATDLEAHQRHIGLTEKPVTVVRLGDGFSHEKRGQAHVLPESAASIEGPFVLFVSTIEVRKNHALLVDVWRMLLERMQAEMVPKLVFAGREGSLTGDLLRQLHATNCLDGKIVLRHALGDDDIASLYRGCEFTLFPSLYEGWGLPVTESLSFGCPCLAASTSSVPEAGGTLARYFDPLDTGDTADRVEAILRDPAGLAAWRVEIVAQFRPVPWSQTATMVLAGVA